MSELRIDIGTPTTPRGRQVPDWAVLAIACVAQFMVVLDVSIVNVALPSIGRDLHYSPTGLQWVVNAYVLTFAGFLLLGGRAADLFGRRRIYLFGLGIFTVSSLVGGLAQNSAWLTSARAVQGIGGALLSPATLTIIVTTFSGARLAKALGVWSAVAGAGGATGVLLGGVLTAEISWRWILFVNIPIGVAGAVAALVYLTEVKRAKGEDAPKLDIAGAITVTAGLAALIYAIVGTDTHAWGSTFTLSILAAAAVLLAIFVFIQAKVASTPIVPFRLFRSRSLRLQHRDVPGRGSVLLHVVLLVPLLAERLGLQRAQGWIRLRPHGPRGHHRRSGEVATDSEGWSAPAPARWVPALRRRIRMALSHRGQRQLLDSCLRAGLCDRVGPRSPLYSADLCRNLGGALQ
jgi:MFS family permease